jgi:hypothetical protein
MLALQKKKILAYVALASTGLAIAILAPIASSAYADHKQREEYQRYATGLSPCGQYLEEFPRYIDSHLPGLPDISIDEFPSFSHPQAIRIVGQDVFFFRVEGKNVTQTSHQRADSVRSAISKKTSAEFLKLVTQEIDNARAELPMGLDGTTYYFRSAKTNKCAMAWSPDDGRAGDLVDIYYSTIRYTLDSKEQPVNERQLRRQVNSLLDQ